jgi:4-hydroxy-tetrahydrodipicolinate reductase
MALALEDASFSLLGAVEYERSPLLGQDAGVVAGVEPIGMALQAVVSPKAGQVVIDFSTLEAMPSALSSAVAGGAGFVCGTTGLQEEHHALLREASAKIPILWSPNMSVGVNLMFLVARQMAKWTGESFDLEIVEAHHRFKRDAPSGTAMRLAEMVAEGRGLSLKEAACYAREGLMPARKKEEIGIQTLRGGDIVGEHTVYFCAMGERLELTHRATSRDIFARGALRAAAWLQGREAGLYSMFDLLSFSAS